MTWISDNAPGGTYSGCPGSRSRTTIPRGLLLPCGIFSVRSLLVSIFENVDFPDDFGPHTRAVRGLPDVVVLKSSESFLFHAGGDTRSCTMDLAGASSDEYNFREGVSIAFALRRIAMLTYYLKCGRGTWFRLCFIFRPQLAHQRR